MSKTPEQLLDAATHDVRGDVEAETASFFEVKTADDYRRYLGRAYGFIAPLERCLLDTTDLDLVIDVRRFRRHHLIEADLLAGGLKLLEIHSLPQCMWIPWFEDVHTALGWAYLTERALLAHPNLFRHLAGVLPGEAAFNASFLKSYASPTEPPWQSFMRGVTRSINEPVQLELTIAGAQAAHRFFRRWRATLDGTALSGPLLTSSEPVAAPNDPAPNAVETASTPQDDPSRS